MKNGNLPAMPQDGRVWCDGIGDCPTLATGLTKREMFAMAALQGMLANSAGGMSYAARDAVLMADELLLQLEKTK